MVLSQVMHQGRGESQRDMDIDGVPLSEIQRMAHYTSDEQTNSYLLNVPLRAILSLAGHDHTEPSKAGAPHLAVPFDMAIIDKYFPELAQMDERIAIEWGETSNNVEAKAKRLFCASGCARAIRFIYEIFIRCCAARPRDGQGRIATASPPLWQSGVNTPSNLIFTSPLFQSPEFIALTALVRAAEERELAGGVSHGLEGTGGGRGAGMATRNMELTPLSERIQAAVDRSLQPLLISQRELFAAVAALAHLPANNSNGGQPPPNTGSQRGANSVDAGSTQDDVSPNSPNNPVRMQPTPLMCAPTLLCPAHPPHPIPPSQHLHNVLVLLYIPSGHVHSLLHLHDLLAASSASS